MKLEKIPNISVGILTASEICFFLSGNYTHGTSSYKDVNGVAKITNGKLEVYLEGELLSGDLSYFKAQDNDSFLEIKDVVIGINFHWERKENQRFKGDLKIIQDTDKCIAINVLSIEEYLESVISSEMSATASEALLKAHAVISRGWLLAQIVKKKHLEANYHSIYETEDELIKWYDREDHDFFDVCADDHCQRYQGITRIGTKNAVEAVRATKGEVLVYDDEICDTRFSKCCGGVVESFENVWEPEEKPYLVSLYDNENESLDEINLQDEQQANKFIQQTPDAFCNTQEPRILSEVLNDYDQETHDFYRWKVRYTQEQLSEIIRKRSGIDFGLIQNLIPVERSSSGRLKKLKIVGERRTRTIGKELEIRKTLSESHLYSSAFIIEREGTDFILKGAGWGHGVGLCQIGAAVMGAKGYTYSEILYHYFKNVELQKIY